MASFLSSPGASAAILLCPNARAGLGSARVALVVTDLPGRDVTPLLGLGIQSPFLSQDFTAMRPRSMLVSALSKDSDGPHLTDFCSQLDDMRSLYMQTLTAAGPDTVERNRELQMKLEVVAEESGKLLRQVVGRLNPAPGSVLYKDLFDMGMKITGVEVSARARRAPWGFAHALSHELDGLRRLASAALNTPLPTKTPEVPPVLMENDEIEVTVLAMLDAQYHSVATDLELMFT